MSIVITSKFQKTREANPAGVNSQFMFIEVIKAPAMLQIPLLQKSIFKTLSFLDLPKSDAINRNDKPIPPQPYISNAQANEPGLAMEKTGKMEDASIG